MSSKRDSTFTAIQHKVSTRSLKKEGDKDRRQQID